MAGWREFGILTSRTGSFKYRAPVPINSLLETLSHVHCRNLWTVLSIMQIMQTTAVVLIIKLYCDNDLHVCPST
jgi:hypothetical protein